MFLNSLLAISRRQGPSTLRADVSNVSDDTGKQLTRTQSLRILVVEDCAIQQTFTALFLKQLGHHVRIASDGLEALSALQLDHYDVILLDCQLPLMSGVAATRFIRRLARMKGQSLTIIGVSSGDAPQECFDAGMDDFVFKPVNKSILRAVLGRSVRKNNAHMKHACK